MFSQLRAGPAILSTATVLLVLLISVGAPGASASKTATAPRASASRTASTPSAAAGQANSSSTGGGPVVSALTSCPKSTQPITSFNASNFPSTPRLDNALYPLTPGKKFILEGFEGSGATRVQHQIITIVTDMTKLVDGVPTVVLWDRDYRPNLQGQLVVIESELAFHAQDNAGNPWNLGEYPAEYTGGTFTGAPSTWIAGLPTAPGQPAAKAGNILPGQPQVGTPPFLQAYAAPDIILDCGQVSQTNAHVCNITGNCYDNVVVIEEIGAGDPASQLKYYSPGVGNFQIDTSPGDPKGETQVLSQTVELNRDECLEARQDVLALEALAYSPTDTSQTAYKQTTPMTSTGYCETLAPPTPTPTPEISPTPTPPTYASHLPLVYKIEAVPPAIYDGCKSDPNPLGAPNYPVRIVGVNKVTEVVTLQNVSDKTISLEDWNMCSLATNQDHDQIFGTIAPGEILSFKNIGPPNVWNDNTRNDGALYNAAGYLVSYWVDQ